MNKTKTNLRKRKRISYFEPDEPTFDEYIYCEQCYDFVYEYCSIHGPLLVIPDDKVTSTYGIPPWVPRAALTTPRQFVHIAPSVIPGAGLGVFSTVTLPRGVRFGPYQGKVTDEITSTYCWQIHTKTKLTVVDGLDGEKSNWMRYVNCARNWWEQNLVAFQYKGQIYYRTVKIVPKFTELLVFYGSEFAHALGIDLKNYNKSPTFKIGKFIIEDVHLNQAATVQDHVYKTEILTICEATPRSEGNIKEIDIPEGRTEKATDKSDGLANQIETINQDRIYETKTLASEAISILYKENTEYIDTYEEIIEKSTQATSSQTEFCIDIRSVDPSNIITTKSAYAASLQTEFCIDPSNIKAITNNQDSTTKFERLTCDKCNKTYKNNDSLRKHKYQHEKPKHSCTQCGYKTIHTYHFNLHMDRHKKDKIFRCEFCSYVGHVKKDLRQHWRRVHRIKTETKKEE